MIEVSVSVYDTPAAIAAGCLRVLAKCLLETGELGKYHVCITAVVAGTNKRGSEAL